MKRRFKKHKRIYLLLILFISIGFAYLSTTLGINGLAHLRQNTWDVHFDNIVVSDGSVEAAKPVIDTNKTTVTFSVPFSEPGDFYEFTVDAVNAGTIGAMIDTFTDVTTYNTNLLNVEVAYDDGEEILQKHLLPANDFVTFKIKASYKEDITKEDLPDEEFEVNVSFSVNYINKDKTAIPRNSDTDKSLYNVFKREALFGNLAKEYTGPHQDSMDASKSNQKIYHWYAETDDEGTEIQNKNNLIFANHCWQMIRTTDTGGVKLLYNGEAVNQQCLNNRNTHPGYYGIGQETLMFSYWYGTDFTYDETSQQYTLSGDKVLSEWNETTAPSLIGKYTCKSSNENGTCNYIYLITSYISNLYANALLLSPYSVYTHYGSTVAYNKNSNLSSVGFKSDSNDYQINSKTLPTETVYSKLQYSGLNGYYSYYFADSVTWDSTNKKYSLINPSYIYPYTNYQSLINKYTFSDKTSETYTANYVYYIVHTTYVMGHEAVVTYYHIKLENGKTLDEYINTYTYGESYTDNGNGTYTINNPTTINTLEWKDNYNNIKNKYVCKNSTNNTCSSMIYITKTAIDSFTYNEATKTIKYAKGFTYENGKYTLNDDSFNSWSYDTNQIKNAHYTCWNNSGECTKISYIFSGTDTTLDYVEITGGKNIEDVINDNLYDESVNKSDSNIKIGIDFWYKKYMLPYDDSIEDTIYCNNRSNINILESGWNPNGGDLSTTLRFNESTDLSCPNITDQFSTKNEKAKLDYKAGLITYPEMYLFNNNNARKSGSNYNYFLGTPYTIGTMRVVDSSGNFITRKTNSTNFTGLRPAISIKEGLKYEIGDGTKENPYYVGEIFNINSDDDSIIIENISPPGKKITIKLVDDKYSVTSFKLNGVTHLGNTFIMPNENVTITDIVKSEVFIVESDHNPYLNNLNNKVYLDKTFEGASALNIELTYQTEGTSWDYIYLYDNASSSTPYNNKKYGGTTQTTENIVLNSNYLKIVFKTDSTSNNYYGFKAVITPIYD